MISNKDASIFIDKLKQAKTVLLCAHVGPDGDTLGSMLGLMHAIKAHFSHFTQVDTAVSGFIPEMFSFLPGIEDIKNADDESTLLAQYDLAICLDCGAVERLGKAQIPFEKAKASLNIDHHYSNLRFATENIIDETAGASGEVVADLLAANNITIPKDAATCLYVAVLTDTGGFKYSSTTAKIFQLASDLTAAGANPEDIYRHIYEECPKSQLMLQAEALLKAQFDLDNRLAWVSITQAMLANHQAKDDHIEGLVEQLRRIKPVLISAVLKETTSGATKISLRSDDHTINVAEILAELGGGGHKMAAGAVVQKTCAEVEAILIPKLRDAILVSAK